MNFMTITYDDTTTLNCWLNRITFTCHCLTRRVIPSLFCAFTCHSSFTRKTADVKLSENVVYHGKYQNITSNHQVVLFMFQVQICDTEGVYSISVLPGLCSRIVWPQSDIRRRISHFLPWRRLGWWSGRFLVMRKYNIHMFLLSYNGSLIMYDNRIQARLLEINCVVLPQYLNWQIPWLQYIIAWRRVPLDT